MKWLSKRINRDPNNPPFKARTFCALTVMFISTTYIMAPQYIGFPRTLAACGIALAVFGAAVLYWETVAEPHELKSVGNEITRTGSSTKLSLGEIVSVIAFAGLGYWIAYLHAGALASAPHNRNHVALYNALRVAPVFIIYALPALGVYGEAKWRRWFCSRWAERLRGSQDRTGINQFLRLIGFASLFLSGWLQLPDIFFR